MAGFLRCLLGLALLPACWGALRALFDSVLVAAGEQNAFSVEAVSLLAGMMAFALCWATISHPVRAYVLGHELTHALWGLLFGGRPSDFHVSASGGSVRLTRTNFIVTLAPYFFPFYTFVVILVAVITSAFIRPLPFLPLWMFMIGFTWAFHLLFTLETLTRQQPDVKLYGRIFSWTLILLVNVALVMVWLATTTSLTFDRLWSFVYRREIDAYLGVFTSCQISARWLLARWHRS